MTFFNQASDLFEKHQNELPRCKQRGINRNIYHRPKERGIKALPALAGKPEGGLVRLRATRAESKRSAMSRLIRIAVVITDLLPGVSVRYKTTHRSA